MSVSSDAVRTAACELFARQGYHGTSMKDIGGALAVSAPNLYNHVPNKQDLLVVIMDTAMDRAHAALDDALAGIDDVGEQLRRATETSVLDFLSHPAEITVCNTEIRSLEEPGRSRIIGKRNAYAARIRAIIEQGCTEGRFRTAHPRPATFAILELPANATAWFNERGRLSAGEVARIYGDFALDIVRCASRRARRQPAAGTSAGTGLPRALPPG
jgi:AcrR family transcriptional regulator